MGLFLIILNFGGVFVEFWVLKILVVLIVLFGYVVLVVGSLFELLVYCVVNVLNLRFFCVCWVSRFVFLLLLVLIVEIELVLLLKLVFLVCMFINGFVMLVEFIGVFIVVDKIIGFVDLIISFEFVWICIDSNNRVMIIMILVLICCNCIVDVVIVVVY